MVGLDAFHAHVDRTTESRPIVIRTEIVDVDLDSGGVCLFDEFFSPIDNVSIQHFCGQFLLIW